MTSLRVMLLFVGIVVAAVVACGDDDDGRDADPTTTLAAAPATVTPTTPAAPTAKPSPSPDLGIFHPDETRSGIDVVDAIIEAVVAGRAEDLVALVRTSEIACLAQPMEVGAPPKCEAGEQEGDLIEELPAIAGEGVHLRREEIPDALMRMVDPPTRLYAVYKATEDDRVFNSPTPAYGVVFGEALESLRTPEFLIDEDGLIVAVGLGSIYPINAIPSGRTLIVPPLSAP